MTGRETQEYQILSIIGESDDPIGAGALRLKLGIRNISISEATVGRILSDLDEAGYTERIGFQGRRLTAKGFARLESLKQDNHRHLYSSELVNLLRGKGRDNLLDILEARRVIERELARLAALKATPEEIQILMEIEAEQSASTDRGEMLADYDIRFHRYIAALAGNKFLQAAMELIRQDAQLGPVLQYIRKAVHKTIVLEHKNIAEAIRQKDPAAAEQAMVRHIDSLISDVKKYWSPAEKE